MTYRENTGGTVVIRIAVYALIAVAAALAGLVLRDWRHDRVKARVRRETLARHEALAAQHAAARALERAA